MVVTYLLDSNVLIDYTSKNFSQEIEREMDTVFDDQFYFSIISRLEVLGFNGAKEELTALEEFLSIGVMYSISNEVADVCIQIRRDVPKTKLPDAIIAATAMVHNHTLVTSNTEDFKNISGLKVLSPKNLKAHPLSDDDVNDLLRS